MIVVVGGVFVALRMIDGVDELSFAIQTSIVPEMGNFCLGKAASIADASYKQTMGRN
jgi:hypothetical protein